MNANTVRKIEKNPSRLLTWLWVSEVICLPVIVSVDETPMAALTRVARSVWLTWPSPSIKMAS